MKFGIDRKFEFKKSFKLYRQTSVRVRAKVAKNFCSIWMAWTKVNKIQQIFNNKFKSV
jgi:hypothetical protein